MSFNPNTWPFFPQQIALGIRYALWFALISAAMGAIFGALGGGVWQPMFFILLLTGILVILNALVALICTIPWLILKLRGSQASLSFSRYIGLSLGFLCVFGSIFILYAPFGERLF